MVAMNDDFEGYDDGEGGGESPHAFQFEQDTVAALVAGRQVDPGMNFTRAALGEAARAVRELGVKRGFSLELVPCADNTDTGAGPEDTVPWSMVVGLPVASGGTYGPEALSRDSALSRLEAAKALPAEVWSEIAALLPESSRANVMAEPIELHLLACGPLAVGKIAFGVPGTEEDAGEGEFQVGQDMSQERHEEGVWGQRVAGTEDTEVVDFSESAHQARVAAFPEGQYFLIARYD